MNSYRPSPEWLPHESPNGPDSPVRADWERYTAGMPASLDLRPVLIAATIGGSLVGSSLLGIENGFGSFWLASNALPQPLIAAWLLIRPGGAAPGPLSGGTLTAFVMVVYGSWAPALAAGESFSPLVPGSIEKSALEYTTAAARAVTGGVVPISSIYAMVRGLGFRVNDRPAVPPRRWWRGVLLMEAIGLCCFVAFTISSSHQPVVSFDLFRPLPPGIAQRTTTGIYQFLGAGIDVSIGAAIAASGLLGLKAYRLRVLAVIALNVFLYTTIGFKYRIVVTLIGVFAMQAATRPNKGRHAPRSERIKVVLAGVAVTTVAFFVVQVYRGNHESSQGVTASSFDSGSLEGIATCSIDIATPYAAIHQQHFGRLLGESYLQPPTLFVPKVIMESKPLPAMSSLIQGVTVPGTGAAVPLWAEADANLGLIGLLGFGAILGWVVSRSYTADRRRMETATMAAATGAVLSSVLSRSLMFFALYEFAAIVCPIWMLSRLRPARGTPGSSERRGRG